MLSGGLNVESPCLLPSLPESIPMSKFRRCVIPGLAHHVYQRGVRKEPLFHEDRDFLVYIRSLKEGCSMFGVSISTYTLMTNHIHLIAVPKRENSISRALHLAHTGYSKYLNAKYKFSGHALEGRPQMCAMDDNHMWKTQSGMSRETPCVRAWSPALKTICGPVLLHIAVCATTFCWM